MLEVVSMRQEAVMEKKGCREEKVAELFLTYSDEILRMCYLYLGDYHLAEDALQETFIRVTKGLGNFQGGSSEKTWIIRIAINVCKTMLANRQKENVQNISGEHIQITFCDLSEDGESGRESIVFRKVQDVDQIIGIVINGQKIYFKEKK